MSNTGASKQMPYVRLGSSGLKISKIILGCMSFGSSEWSDWVINEKEGIDVVRGAVELGINTFDTANMYSNGHSEIVLGKAIKELKLKREAIVVMTKVYFPAADSVNERVFPQNADESGYANRWGLSRKHIFASVRASLDRLQLDYVDVLQCHRFDSDTPVHETMQALHDVVKLGWVRYIGMSSCYAYQFHQMQNYAISHNLTPFISMQNHYSLLYREEEREMMPTLEHFGVGSIPWGPIARGILARPWSGRNDTTRGRTDNYINLMMKAGIEKSDHDVVDAVEALAKKKGITMAQLSVAWILSKKQVSAPIVGTSRVENLRELAQAVHITLTEDEIKSLEEPYLARPIFGHS